MGMKLVPAEKKDNGKFESLVCHLIEGGMDVSLMNDQNEVSVWLSTDAGWSLVFTRDGKWRME